MQRYVVKAWIIAAVSCVGLGVSLSACAQEEQKAAEKKVEEGSTGQEGNDAGAEAESKTGPNPSKKAIPTPFPGILLEDPRGKADLTVCSQNLKLLGTFEEMQKKNVKFSKGVYNEKLDALTVRFLKGKCDVIALQEVMGTSTTDGEAALKPLVERLKNRSNREFEAKVGPTAEGGMAIGFLVAKDRATIINILPYARVELPKLVAKQRPRLFTRTPLEVQLSVRSRDDDTTKIVSLVNFHLKSKRGGEGDPTGLEWETFRMEMAEAFRRIIEVRHQKAFASSEQILIVLGDRNSNFDVASARILDGSLTLENFQANGGCRVSKRGFPVCKTGKQMPQRLFSVLTANQEVATYPGTFSYQGEYSWLDEILMPAESLPYAWLTSTSEGRYDSGVISEPAAASDHSMVWVRLNW